jgi:hypothetical protein
MRQLQHYNTTLLNCEKKDSPHYDIEYYLISDVCEGEDVPSHKAYGVEIRLCLQGKPLDINSIADITSSKEKAESLIKLFSEALVTPVTLKDVIEDTLGCA